MNILIIEDHPLIKSAMQELLHNLYPEAEIYAFTYPSAAKVHVDNRNIDLMLVDLEFNNHECGIEFVNKFQESQKRARCIAYTTHKVNQILKDIKKAGFNSYINKDANEEELCREIEACMNHPMSSFYESTSYLKHKKAFEEQQNKYFSSDYEKIKSLTPKEKEALVLIAEENTASNEDIARKMGVSINTVKKHINKLYLKIGLKSKDGIRAFVERVFSNN